MIRPPPRSTRTDTLFPYTTLFRSIAEFVALLRAADVDRVVDIRTIPRSRTNPQYNKDTLPAHLSAFGIDYTQIAELGGRRSKSKTIPPQLNAYWDNRSFHNYADYALTETFASGQIGRAHV